MAKPEAQLLTSIKDTAEVLQWAFYHTRDSRGSDEGYPDVTLARGDRLILAELKSPQGRLSVDQELWLEVLADTCAEVYLWRDSDQVAEVLDDPGARARACVTARKLRWLWDRLAVQLVDVRGLQLGVTLRLSLAEVRALREALT